MEKINVKHAVYASNRRTSLTCTLQTSHHPPSWAGSQGLGEHLLSLWLRNTHIVFISNLHPCTSIELLNTVIALPGYLPPLFLLMKHTMRRTRMRRAMAHISPMNHPWVAMSTCRLGTAECTDDGKQTVSINCVNPSWLKKKKGGICFLHAERHWDEQKL